MRALTLKIRETHLLFLSVIINGLECVGVDIESNTCARECGGRMCQNFIWSLME